MWKAGTITAAERWRRQHKTEMSEEKWYVAYIPPGAITRLA